MEKGFKKLLGNRIYVVMPKESEAEKKLYLDSNTKEALEKDDLDVIKKKTEDLTQSSMKMGEAMYKDQQSEQSTYSPDSSDTNSGDDSKKDDDVIDADFEEVDEDKTADSK